MKKSKRPNYVESPDSKESLKKAKTPGKSGKK
jgi:hypothetical protein